FRQRVLRRASLPSVTGAGLWAIGVVIFPTVPAQFSSRWAITVAVTAVLGGLMVTLMTYMEAERLVRPVAARALEQGSLEQSDLSPMSTRLMATWVLTNAVPVLGILLLIFAQAR